jgi:hypothetical protein
MTADREADAHGALLFDPPIEACPACGSTALDPVVDDGALHFLCEKCSRCWHVELGAVRRVDQETCARIAAHDLHSASGTATDHRS